MTGLDSEPLATTVTVVIAVVIGVVIGCALMAVVMTRRIAASRERAALAEGALAALRADNAALRTEQGSVRSMEELLQPVRESIDSLARVTAQAGRDRTAAEATITTTLQAVQERYQSLEEATGQIAAALSKGQTRGQWGEMQLERLLEHAGLLEGTHFERQQGRAIEERVLRPDVVVMLPAGGEILIDAKFPFDSYWQALASDETATRAALMAKHAADVFSHAKELSAKRYSNSATSADFIVMFLPVESLLSSALEADGLLLEKAFDRGVVLATPTTMLALLRTVTFGYQRSLMAQNAEQIQSAGAEMLTRLGVLVEHVEVMRRGLDQAVKGYNAFVGSFDRQAMRQARRLSELGVSSTRPLEAPDALDVALRESDPAALRG